MDIDQDNTKSPNSVKPKQIAQAHLSFVKNLMQYNLGES